jgi:succinate-semialdehyde dehydrogenase/glutarate-semialdehyde dehydrogenase
MTSRTSAVETRLLLDGEWRMSDGGGSFPVWDPAAGTPIADVADATRADTLAAVEAASRALGAWAHLAPGARFEILQRAVADLRRREEEIAHLIVRETGKPLTEARGEIWNAIRFFDFFSHETLRLPGEYWPGIMPDRDAYVSREPVGVVGAITPWNFPAFMVACKVGAALAAGCAVILKPAEQTPLTALAIAESFQAAGLPGGVLSVLPTSDPGAVADVLLQHPDVACLTFTGSTSVGRKLLAGAAPGIKRVLLELGGNAPVLVSHDADVDAIVEPVVRARYANAGQACVAANRIYVHEAVADRFLARFTSRVDALTVGDPWAATTDLGPLIDLRAVETIEERVARAVADGASLHTGGVRVRETGPSAYVRPGILTVPGAGSDALREEFFGPVASVIVTSSDEESVALANDTVYGLSAYVFAGDAVRARTLAEQLRVGTVGVNCALVSDPALPFGGVRMSGIGRERGRAGVEEFLESKTIHVGRS